MATTLGREDILDGLRALITELRASGQIAGIRIIGGAALALRYFDRGTTQDPDSLHIDPGSNAEVAAAAAKVAQSRGWDPGWLNFDVEKADALPTFGRRLVEWETIYDHDGIVIQVAAKEAMLAMKLRANRPGRDTNDIRQLLRLCDVRTLDEAEELYEDFYPGDALSDRAVKMVAAILDAGLPDEVPSPGPIEL
ncbi:hypothetical protein J2Y46_002383 [Microbacterium sp. BE35]|uniref:hypothetical protein n=1 Tax=Microbacterium sp. BE35 TaxID=2817773 RepID=UPI00285E6BD3|nr:hypothetical protein [Microbacterium sp. BE35]MDR7189557.1 hypothetical protein [Microbacterium sp. BE35]